MRPEKKGEERDSQRNGKSHRNTGNGCMCSCFFYNCFFYITVFLFLVFHSVGMDDDNFFSGKGNFRESTFLSGCFDLLFFLSLFFR